MNHIIKDFYNKYHKSNYRMQEHVIGVHNYTYQVLLFYINKYFRNDFHVLDVGCGVGTVDFYMSTKGIFVEGIDLSSDAIKLAKKSALAMNLNNKFTCGDVAQIKFNSKFDGVVCSEVIEHVPNDKELLDKISAALKKDGILILSTPSKYSPLFKMGLLKKFDDEVGHLRRYEPVSLISLIENAGFRIIEHRKTEGILRNLLFTSNRFKFLVRFIKWPLTYPVNLIDTILLLLFGEANYYVIAQKR